MGKKLLLTNGTNYILLFTNMNYIENLEEAIKPSKRSNKYDAVCDWWDNMREESIRNQIELYKIWKGRLQVTN